MVLGNAIIDTFETAIAYKELNMLTGDIAAGGILQIGEQLAPSLSSGVVTVATGVVAFGGGIRLKISEQTEFTALDGIIYAAYNITTQTGGVYYSETVPNGVYVPICTISDGAIDDIRQFAQYNVARKDGNSYDTCTLSRISILPPYVTNEWQAISTCEMPNDFSVALITYDARDTSKLRAVELIDGGESDQYSLTLKYSASASVVSFYGKISREGRKLTFWLKKQTSGTQAVQNALPSNIIYLA